MKKLKLFLFVGLLGILGGYTYLWYLAANKLEMAVVEQATLLEEKGYRIAYGAIRVKGFPLKINLEIDDAVIEAPGAVAASLAITGTLHGYASIFSPTAVEFYTDQGVEVKTALLSEENNTVLKASGLTATMHLPKPLQNFKVTLQNPYMGGSDVKAHHLSLGLKLHESDSSPDLYSVEITEIDPGKQLVSSFPQIIDSLQAEVSLKGKVRVDIPLETALTNWYESAGTLDVGTLSVKWGDLRVDLNGTCALDQGLQPLAAFSAEIYGLNAILKKLSELGFIHENILPVLKASLNFLKESKKSDRGHSIYHKVSITLQDNDLVIGSIPVVKFPPINWSKSGD
ncbi:MAG: DUF2125 domain-containing protein [Alphaproteobacteria bacterium]|nr:DUF2125 domain-containing protein [Candidatus Parcubacteria bacterium]NCQ67556.1 DUF2125 domain-containing protein [Alphaproteobacteria bacterium]